MLSESHAMICNYVVSTMRTSPHMLKVAAGAISGREQCEIPRGVMVAAGMSELWTLGKELSTPTFVTSRQTSHSRVEAPVVSAPPGLQFHFRQSLKLFDFVLLKLTHTENPQL